MLISNKCSKQWKTLLVDGTGAKEIHARLRNLDISIVCKYLKMLRRDFSSEGNRC